VNVGPITIFDKSALQALSLDEAVWFDNFYLGNITPLFFVETLADLERIDAKRLSPEEVVGGLAAKTAHWENRLGRDAIYRAMTLRVTRGAWEFPVVRWRRAGTVSRSAADWCH
jgi:hypothetical protein